MDDSSTKTRILSRGYCVAEIRPQSKGDAVLDRSTLRFTVFHALSRTFGFQYPALEIERPVKNGANFVEQDFDHGEFCETWRMHCNGHFIALKGFPSDWADDVAADNEDQQAKRRIMSLDFLMKTAFNLLNFLRNMSGKLPDIETWHVSLDLFNTRGRSLRADTGVFQADPHVTVEDQIFSKETVNRADILGNPATPSSNLVAKLGESFGMESAAFSPQRIREIYRRVYRI